MEKRDAVEEFNRMFRHGDQISWLVLILVGIFTLVPALSLTGETGYYEDRLRGIPIYWHFILSTIGTLLFFCLYFPDRSTWYLGIIPGIITGPLVLVSIVLYVSLRGYSNAYELLIPVFLACLPCGLVWYLILRSRTIKKLMTDSRSDTRLWRHADRAD